MKVSCKHGHVAERYKNGSCVECVRINNMRSIVRESTRNSSRNYLANSKGYMPPPPERECPPRPEDGCCQCCGNVAKRLVLDHDHGFLGDFSGWVCYRCNTLGDDIAELQTRIDYLKARGFT